MRTNKLAVACLAAAVVCGLVAGCGAKPVPVVVWHGMGDHGTSKGMTWVQDMIKKQVPGIYTYSVVIGKNAEEDVVAGFIGNMWEQVAGVVEAINADAELADGFSILTFSQGGQLVRGMIERYADVLPPIHNVVTYGGQHQGVSDAPGCVDPDDGLCHLAADLIDKGAYLPEVREYSVQAQYYLDPMHWDEYVKYSQFIADINNERPVKNATYKANLLTVDTFVCILWLNDTVVVPRESEHFGRFKIGSLSETVSMFDTPLYQEDWIGLKELYESNRLVFLETLGNHMTINETLFIADVVVPYLSDQLPTQ